MNVIFMLIFAMEMNFKMVGFGFRAYFQEKVLVFDFIYVIVGIVDAVITFMILSPE